MQDIDITPDQRKILIDLLNDYLPDVKVWVYGSRIKGTARPQSDLDLAVFTSVEQKRAVAALKEALEESQLPFRVDLFVWDEIPEQFRDNIQQAHVILVNAHSS
ncbi:nucleotidyltransferase domain-containing protein [Nitrosomonas sp. Is35]|uniref:nucleotidyltransferase family protein n=1 Tax=Nitrosomonas sp. Is35 TaxID=3080534 RepID=UPI00294B8483|nr:nucleotidyltransferase domain-containing protein [Nitrosomonas sp. Is35]MDV6348779.1 nucleotidyltransferase domain-containing protein [Nitrosomonas sp. Is35]